MLLKNFKVTLCDLRVTRNCNEIEDVMSAVKSGNIEWKLSESNDPSNNEYGKIQNKVKVNRKVVKIHESKKNSRKILSDSEEKEEEESDDENDSYEVKKVKLKRKVVRIHESKKNSRKIVSDSEEESSSDENSSSENKNGKGDDPDFDIKVELEKKERAKEARKFKKANHKNQHSDFPEFEDRPKRELSAYEQMIEKNRLEKLAFLQSIKIEEAKVGLSEAVSLVDAASRAKKQIRVKRQYKEVEKKSPPVIRKSRRLANISVDLSEESLYANAIKAAEQEEAQKRVIPPELSFKDALADETLYDSYLTDLNIQKPETDGKFCLYDKSVLKNMTVSEKNTAKVTPARITAVTWYPSPDHLIVSAGDKYGNLGIWNIGSECDPYVMKIHLEGITNLQFNPFNPVNLVSSSYDGILRCGDMIQHNFNEIYNVSDETCCTYFDFLSASTYLVAQKNGMVALVDQRVNSKVSEKKHTCHQYSVKTVNIHPTNKNFFVSAENKGSIRLWDLRKLQRNPVADIIHHKRCVQSAFFSPVTGNSILATSADDSVSIFDSTNLTSDIRLKQHMKHDNQTGRWLSVFRAIWLPNSEEAFCIGSMQYPRRIEIYDKNMFAYIFLKDENLTTITSTNAFHPMKPALAGANSSGKVFVFS